MRDIRGRRPEQDNQPQLPPTTPPTFLERLMARVNELGGRLSQLGEPADGTEPTLAAPVRKKRRLPRGVVTKAGRGIKKAAHQASNELRKPGRKTALIHTVALGALFALVLSNNPWAPASSTGGTTTEKFVRRYLPSIATTTELTPLDPAQAVVSAGHKLNLYGWITPWNLSSGGSLLYAAASAFWLTIGEDGVTLAPKADWAGWHGYKQERGITESYLTVTGDPDHTYKVLSDLDLQSQHIGNLLNTVRDQGFTGIDIDYEALGSENRELFTGFIRNLSTVFHQNGKKVAVTLEARIANQVPMDWYALGQLADEVRIMAYDYHGKSTGQPGPIAPVAWVAEVVAYAAERIEPNKLIIGLGNYGYDWKEPLTPAEGWEGVGISFEQAVSLSEEHAAQIIRRTGIDERGYDIGTVPSFSYVDTQGRRHEVWFEDATSIQEKMNAIAAYQVKGVMFWSVGAGDPALWTPQ